MSQMNFWKRGEQRSHKRLKTFGPSFSELDNIHQAKKKKKNRSSRISCSKAQRCKKTLFYSGHEAGRYNVKWRRGGGLRERPRVPGDELGHIMRTKHPE